MKTLLIAVSMTLITSVVINVYAISAPPVIVTKEVIKPVAITEVRSIPYTYDVNELDAYFEGDYCSRNKCVDRT